MRQILVLGLLLAIGWWVYDSYFVDATQAASPSGGPGAAVGEQVPRSPLAELIGQGGERGAEPAADPGRASAPAPQAALDADGQKALDALVAGIGRLDAAAIDQGWIAVASGQLAAGPRQRIAAALAADGDFEAMFARLGSHNAFLHDAAGRELAERVFAAAMALPDAAAVAAGTKFLNLCLRGPIEKAHATARAAVDRAYAKYRVRADRWLCDPQNVAGARSYTVKSGDHLNGIARKFRAEGVLVDEGTIAVLNRIHNKNAIQVGQRLKVPVEPIHSVVEKRSYSFAIYVGEHLLRLYWVGHGQHDKTPVTTFTVGEKQPRPQWTAPDGNVWPYGHPNNILGEYFIKFRHPSYTGFGAHGTPMPDTIGTMSSMGCIRMHAQDIAELFEILPRGTTVEVRASGAP